jgi:carbon storage regulator CsrA
MLVLSRKDGNAVHVGDDVVVRVLRIGRSQVKLGIEAPESTPIWREELSDSFGWGLQPTSQRTGRPSAGRRTEILLVEDNPDHAELISRVLCDSEPVEVAIVRSGEAAIDLLGIGDGRMTAPQSQYDLILMDQCLPGTSGIEVLRRIRTAPDWFATPVVMLTCMDDEGLVADCFEAGANAFVVKSGDMRVFRTTISRIATFWGSDCRTPKPCVCLPR